MKIIFTERVTQSFDCIALQKSVEKIDLTGMRRTFGECSELWFDPARMQLCWRNPAPKPRVYEFPLLEVHYGQLGKPKPTQMRDAHTLACFCGGVGGRGVENTFYHLRSLAECIDSGMTFDVTYEE